MQLTTTGIVIKEKTVGDDRLLHLLTKDNGVVFAIARGAKKPRGKLTSSTELFCYANFVLFCYRDSYTVDSAECEDAFFELRSDLEALALAAYISELSLELCPREEPAAEYLSLLLNTLHLLRKKTRPLQQVKAIFELRLLSMAGFMPDLTGCSGCQKFEGGQFFAFVEGNLTCAQCNPRPQQEGIILSSDLIAAMRHILYSEPKKIFAFSLPPEQLAELGFAVERYMMTHLQKSFKSLSFFHSLVDTRE